MSPIIYRSLIVSFVFYCFLLSTPFQQFVLLSNDSLLVFTSPLKLEQPQQALTVKTPDLVHPFFPFTQWKHVKPCGEFFDEVKEFNKALECSNKNRFDLTPINQQQVFPPRCFIITTDSPDIRTSENGVFNYWNIGFFFYSGIVGLYEPEQKTIFIAENFDAPMIYRHELQHYFLDLMEGDGNGRHDDLIWSVCEPSHYSPSQEALANAGVNRKSN